MGSLIANSFFGEKLFAIKNGSVTHDSVISPPPISAMNLKIT